MKFDFFIFDSLLAHNLAQVRVRGRLSRSTELYEWYFFEDTKSKIKKREDL